jgi:hypothetical protein
MTWHNRAACAGYSDPDAFVPHTTSERQQLRETKTARAICAMCPVSDQCLTDADKERDFYTVRGGTVPIARVPGKKHLPPSLPRAGEEAMWLWDGGLGPEHIAQAMNVKVASVERAIMRAGIKIPWTQMGTTLERATA